MFCYANKCAKTMIVVKNNPSAQHDEKPSSCAENTAQKTDCNILLKETTKRRTCKKIFINQNIKKLFNFHLDWLSFEEIPKKYHVKLK